MKRISSILKHIKKTLILCAGVIGGFVLGILLCSIPLHLNIKYQIDLPLLPLAALLIAISSLAGAINPRHFMQYVLCPLVWLLSDTDAPDSHPSDY